MSKRVCRSTRYLKRRARYITAVMGFKDEPASFGINIVRLTHLERRGINTQKVVDYWQDRFIEQFGTKEERTGGRNEVNKETTVGVVGAG